MITNYLFICAFLISIALPHSPALILPFTLSQKNSEMWKETVKRGQSCRVIYISGKDDMLAAGDLIICRYLMRTEGHEVVGAFSPCVQHGMLQCRFNKQVRENTTIPTRK